MLISVDAVAVGTHLTLVPDVALDAALAIVSRCSLDAALAIVSRCSLSCALITSLGWSSCVLSRFNSFLLWGP